ncbi:MAG TPA: type I restriction-modification system subunit M N-terminal domain-containing protein, partial [Dongiaceae bacterium]|nr:type I restriction-modification system subunit M N-terminal domain-containing protein [Dongiaceae bacterium]
MAKKPNRKLDDSAVTNYRDKSNGAGPDINIEGELWEAAVRLRGNVAPADYKHYVLPLLFLRHMS